VVNNVVLVGRLTRSPELRYTENKIARASFTLAVDRPFTNQNGEREADFVPIVVWRGLAETCAKHLQKGRLVAVEGRLQTRRWEDKEGNRRLAVEVVAERVRFLDWGKQDKSSQGVGGHAEAMAQEDGGNAQEEAENEMVPF